MVERPTLHLRLAFREDGKFWRAYYVPTSVGMGEALEICSVRANMVRGDEKLSEQFKALAKDLLNRAIRETMGAASEVKMWDEHLAPDNEGGAPKP
jgi:hypothetical protein